MTSYGAPYGAGEIAGALIEWAHFNDRLEDPRSNLLVAVGYLLGSESRASQDGLVLERLVEGDDTIFSVYDEEREVAAFTAVLSDGGEIEYAMSPPGGSWIERLDKWYAEARGHTSPVLDEEAADATAAVV